ncbi:hypothetical protein EJ08DRAFT_659538 [Tothia fuscella]|uniref:BTB domain-containing protein n=1 Tax=Tothia fuscella TaxID=1048955 RepID=A0A9P4NV85_9PEZI|nr:hypothetical protein EJ08DRAFT_659538 [Tothia fuscella]
MPLPVPRYCQHCKIRFLSGKAFDRHLPCGSAASADSVPTERTALNPIIINTSSSPVRPQASRAKTPKTASITGAENSVSNTTKVRPGTCMPPSRGYRSTKPLLDRTVAMITVGQAPETQVFPIPREYLMTVSEYFEDGFNGNFSQAQVKNISKHSMKDVSPTTFGIFNEWIMTKKLLNPEGESYTYKSRNAFNRDMEELLSLYIFAIEYSIPQLERDIIDVWIQYQEKSSNLCDYETISRAYKELPPTSPLIRFLVDSYADDCASWGNGQTTEMREWELNAAPKEFFYDLMVRLAKKMANIEEGSPYADRCAYHDHVESEEVKVKREAVESGAEAVVKGGYDLIRRG